MPLRMQGHFRCKTGHATVGGMTVCTAIVCSVGNTYFGRNLDLEYHYREAVTVTPRNYSFRFRNGKTWEKHYAMIGMATVSDGYPLYYDATNEKGLSLAGLNFPQNAAYYPPSEQKENVGEALEELTRLNLWTLPFGDAFPLSPLHWLLADKHRAVTLEPMKDGLVVHENPVGVLTNNPPFEFHLHNLANYLNLTPLPPQNRFSKAVDLHPYSLGMGAMGLPGDPSSASRFVRAAFTKLNSRWNGGEEETVSQFFHILKSVEQPKGVTCVRGDEYEYTVYSSCCNADTGVYYYTTYENSQITAVDLHGEDLNGGKLITYPLNAVPQIRFENRR